MYMPADNAACRIVSPGSASKVCPSIVNWTLSAMSCTALAYRTRAARHQHYSVSQAARWLQLAV